MSSPFAMNKFRIDGETHPKTELKTGVIFFYCCAINDPIRWFLVVVTLSIDRFKTRFQRFVVNDALLILSNPSALSFLPCPGGSPTLFLRVRLFKEDPFSFASGWFDFFRWFFRSCSGISFQFVGRVQLMPAANFRIFWIFTHGMKAVFFSRFSSVAFQNTVCEWPRNHALHPSFIDLATRILCASAVDFFDLKTNRSALYLAPQKFDNVYARSEGHVIVRNWLTLTVVYWWQMS